MRSLNVAQFRVLVGLVAASLAATTCVRQAAAQYVYQPGPSYYQNDTAGGTVVGGALGAITGAAVAGRGDRGAGALIGAGVGAITGNLLGRSKDAADERRAASGQYAVNQMNAQAAATAVTNYDVMQMAHAGLSDDLIISTMRSRGARIDLSPQALIQLKQQGVSDRVVVAAQQMGSAPGYYAAPAPITTVVSEVPPPPTVIVAPAYRPYPCYYGPRPYYYHHHPHTYVRVGF